MRRAITTFHYGLGPIGAAIADLCCRHPALEPVGAVDISPEVSGRRLGDILGVENAGDVVVASTSRAALADTRPQVVIHCTGSRLVRVLSELLECVEAGCDVVSTCEELVFPFARHPAQAQKLDRAAKAHRVRVLGCGVNPGFVMDLVPLALSAGCREIKHISVERVVDVAKRRLPLQRKVGVGLAKAEFRRLASMGELGHVGLVESAQMLCAGLGWKLDFLEETVEPVLASPPSSERTGMVIGLRQEVTGSMGSCEVLRMTLEMYAGAPEPRDTVTIEGIPSLRASIQGGLHGDLATANLVVNAIPLLLPSPAGLRTLLDLPPPRSWWMTDDKGRRANDR